MDQYLDNSDRNRICTSIVYIYDSHVFKYTTHDALNPHYSHPRPNFLRPVSRSQPIFAKGSPDFNLTDTHGNEWRLSDLRGKVVILNYWATWCGPCRSEFPHYQDLVDSYASADDVGFLAITTDKDPSETREFLDETGYRFTVLFDKGSETDFRVNGLPTHIILGPEGRIQYKSSGFPGAERYTKEMQWRIEALRVAEEGEPGSAAAPSGG